MSIRVMRTNADWIGRDGKLGFNGVEYVLPQLDTEDVKILDIKIKEEKEIFEEMLKREDFKEIDGWESYVREKINIRRRQLTAICVEFLRRKKLDKPLEKFAFAAVYALLGEGTLKQVKIKAKELQEEEKKTMPSSQRTEPWIPTPDRERMCGIKVRHEDKDSAKEHIKSMKANGKNTRGLSAYGPCPFCGYYHVGHKPKEVLWSHKDLEID